MTANEIITVAHKKVGISNPNATQLDDGLVLLNNMIGSWSAEGLIIPYKTTENVALVVGQASYTIGSAGNFDTVRPIKIINAFIRDSNNVDYVVDVSMTREEYNDISSKNADARPGRLFYDPQYPLGYIYFDYEPTAVENIYLTSEKMITELATGTTEVSLPDYYKEALIYNLAIRIADEFDYQLLPTVIQIAITSKNTVENMVALDRLVKTSKMDDAMTYILYRG